MVFYNIVSRGVKTPPYVGRPPLVAPPYENGKNFETPLTKITDLMPFYQQLKLLLSFYILQPMKFEVHDKQYYTVNKLEKGMKQRLSIAAALLADPPVLILDEPTNGLDPQGIAEIRELISEIAKQGKTIVLASHLLDEVQKVCSHFCILRKGVKLHEGSVNDILGETNVVDIVSEDMDALLEAVTKFEGTEKTQRENGTIKVFLKEGQSSDLLNKYCFDQGITLKKLIPQSKSLEQEFLKILKEND